MTRNLNHSTEYLVASHLQLAMACRPFKDKGEDRVFIHRLPYADSFLMGVADGISRANGGAAADWIEAAMDSIACEIGAEAVDARTLFDRFQAVLTKAAQASQLADSHSTLSCGVGRLVRSEKSAYLRFEFFGIGDSPIWRVMPCGKGNVVFQVSPVYSPPIPSEQAGLYSSVNLSAGRVDGPVHFGSVDLNAGELLIVATDGLPESRVLFDDQDSDRSERSPKLIENLLRREQIINDEVLLKAIEAYDSERLLIDDDASLAVARWRHPIALRADETGGPAEEPPAEPPSMRHVPSTLISEEGSKANEINQAVARIKETIEHYNFFFRYMRQHYSLDSLVDYRTEAIPETSEVDNPAHRTLNGQVRKKRRILDRKRAEFGALTLEGEIEPETFERRKAEFQECIAALQKEVAALKAKRKATQPQIPFHDLPEEERFKRLSTQNKHFVDTIKMIAYRAETAMAQTLPEKMARYDDARSLLRAVHSSEIDLLPNAQEKTLTVRLHPLANQSSDDGVRHLCAELNRAELLFPGTDLRLVYELVSSHNR